MWYKLIKTVQLKFKQISLKLNLASMKSNYETKQVV